MIANGSFGLILLISMNLFSFFLSIQITIYSSYHLASSNELIELIFSHTTFKNNLLDNGACQNLLNLLLYAKSFYCILNKSSRKFLKWERRFKRSLPKDPQGSLKCKGRLQRVNSIWMPGKEF